MSREIRTGAELGLEIELLPPTTLGQLKRGSLCYRPRPDDPAKLDIFVVDDHLTTSVVIQSFSPSQWFDVRDRYVILPRQTPVVPLRIVQRCGKKP